MSEIIGKWALITGASSGLGTEFARLLAEKGCHLVLVARRKDELVKVRNEIHGHYENLIEVIPKDLSSPNAGSEIYQELQSKKIKIDVLVNNAGFGLFGQFLNRDLGQMLNMVDLNIKSLIDLTYRFAHEMKENKFGFILNVASTAGFQPVPNFAVYSATKSFVLNWSEALHEEFKKHNVSVTTLCPGATRTNFFKTSGEAPTAQSAMLMDSQIVCKLAIEGLFQKKMTIIPGLRNKLMVFLERFTPRSLVVKFAALFMKQKGPQT